LITIVSGLPRSGTSLMMQMLAAGGMTILTDNERKPDADNPRGYCEWEPAKLLPTHPERIDEAEGKAVKVITQLLMSIPRGRDYRVIFMERPLAEVLASQDEMLRRRGKSDVISNDVMGKAFASHIKEIVSWFENRSEIPVLRLGYRRLLQNPLPDVQAVKDFLGTELDLEAMTRQVDPALYRNRSS
jgi:LPS sulfotransferase NodH